MTSGGNFNAAFLCGAVTRTHCLVLTGGSLQNASSGPALAGSPTGTLPTRLRSLRSGTLSRSVQCAIRTAMSATEQKTRTRVVRQREVCHGTVFHIHGGAERPFRQRERDGLQRRRSARTGTSATRPAGPGGVERWAKNRGPVGPSTNAGRKRIERRSVPIPINLAILLKQACAGRPNEAHC
jgi:hypothetical protein